MMFCLVMLSNGTAQLSYLQKRKSRPQHRLTGRAYALEIIEAPVLEQLCVPMQVLKTHWSKKGVRLTLLHSDTTQGITGK